MVLGGGAGAVALALGVAFAWPRAPKPRLETAAPVGPRVLARVGPVLIRDVDLARFQSIRALWVGVSGEPDALKALCERTRLGLWAAEQGWSPNPAEVRQDVFRKKTIIGSLAAGGTPGRSSAPLERAEEILAERGIAAQEFESEVRADLAAKAARTQWSRTHADAGLQDLLPVLEARWPSL